MIRKVNEDLTGSLAQHDDYGHLRREEAVLSSSFKGMAKLGSSKYTPVPWAAQPTHRQTQIDA